jgi:hypothetical protein
MLKIIKNLFIASAIVQSSATESEPPAHVPRMLTTSEFEEFHRSSHQIVLKNKGSILDGFELFRPYRSVKKYEDDDKETRTFSMK